MRDAEGCLEGAGAGFAVADLAWEEEVGGIWGGGSLLSVCLEPGSRSSHSQLDGRVVPAGGHKREFDARCPWFASGNVCAYDRLGVLYKLLAVCLGDGILNVTYSRFWMLYK